MNFKILKYPLWLFGSLCLMAVALTAANRPVTAGEDLEIPDLSRQTESMKQMLADHKPAENLQPMAMTPCVGGMAGTYPCDKVDLMAFMPLATIGGGNGNDIWGWTDPQTGKEYAIMGRTNGSAYVDISDPENPIYLGNLPTQTGNAIWRDIKVYNNYAFVVSEASGHGMQVFDLTRLRDVVSPPVTFTVDAHYNQFGNAHNIVINEDTGFAYAVGTGTCSGGLHMVNIQNPTSPTNAGCFSSDGYTHDAQCVTYNGPDTEHVGDEICFNSNEDTVTIVDVTNKAAPVQLARQGYVGSAYTHQGWLTEDHTYLLVDDELDEQSNGHNTRTYIWDVSNLEAPTLIGNFTAPVAAIDHNLYTKDGYVFQGNYQGGLRILDAANVASGSMTQYGFFDIYPAGNSANFNGAWSVFPYYESGLVVISGIEQGLFIVRPNLASDFNLSATPATVNVCVGDDAVYEVTATSILNFDDPVTLSTAGVPAPAAAVFGTNPITPTASTSMTIDTTGVTVGNYTIEVIGTFMTNTHTTTVGLEVVAGAPTVPNLTAPADGATGVDVLPTFSWSATAGASQYLLEIATDSGFSTIVYTTTVASTSHTLAPGDALDSNTTYFWRVSAQNDCGTSTASAAFDFTTESTAGSCPVDTTPNVVYQTDFESGTTGWSHSGTGDTWALSSARVTSGVNAWFAQDTSTLSDQRLVSPAIAVPNVSQAPLTLQFWNYQAFEEPNPDGTCWDAGILEVSTNGGSSWSKVPTSALLTDPYDATIWNDTPGNNPITVDYGPTDAWCPNPPPQPYVNSVVDISAYAGQTVHFRWRLGTDSAAGNEGWYIDDVKVQSCVAEGGPTPEIELDVTVGTDPHTCASTDSVNLPAGGGEVTYCYEVTNTGTVTLTTHDLVDSEWGTLLDNFSYSLAPGASVFVTETATVMASVVNTGTWTAGDGSVEAMAEDSASVTVTPSVFDLEVSADQMMTSTAGSTITYTITITNAGNVADTAELMAMGNDWDTTYPMTVTLASGETVEVEIVVTIPVTATAGMTDTAMIHVTSAGDSGEVEMVNLTTMVSATPTASYQLYLPVINRAEE